METLAAGFEKQKGGLRYQFIQRMEKQAAAGKQLLHYEGSLETGKVFDSSYQERNNRIQTRSRSSDRRMGHRIKLETKHVL
jgi:FKBP-type peptidyl-prolyl cis-trans isomerase